KGFAALLDHGTAGGNDIHRASRRSYYVRCNETGTKYYCERKACAPDYNPKFLVNALRVDSDAPTKDEWGCQIPREHYGYTEFMYRDSSVRLPDGKLWEGWTGMSEGEYRDIKKDIADFLDTFEFGPDDVPVSDIPRTPWPNVTVPRP
ncbi:hypothetical protein, partial [Roseibium sp. RKSG952]|uniref:hypothetical protein n=1 Tax=Roseibium sp. RKSG952 TaxID=2529384 RepID=UPI001AD93BC6